MAKKTKKPFWEEDEQQAEPVDDRSDVERSIDHTIDMLGEIKQIRRFQDAVASVGQPMSNVLGPKRSAVYDQVIGIWLVKRDYATKQRGQPSDYRKFAKPITLSHRAEKRIFP